MFGVEEILQTIPNLGSPLCIGIIVLVLIIFLFAYVLSLLIEFLPATLLAILVYIFTGDLMWSIVAFLVVAMIMAFSRRRKRVIRR